MNMNLKSVVGLAISLAVLGVTVLVVSKAWKAGQDKKTA
jgi:hypothetical protein